MTDEFLTREDWEGVNVTIIYNLFMGMSFNFRFIDFECFIELADIPMHLLESL